MVRNEKTGLSRRYAFVEFENERSMKGTAHQLFDTFNVVDAYKDADQRRIDQSRILVDVERGRAVKNWIPRRCGGGLGGKVIPVQAPPYSSEL